MLEDLLVEMVAEMSVIEAGVEEDVAVLIILRKVFVLKGVVSKNELLTAMVLHRENMGVTLPVVEEEHKETRMISSIREEIMVGVVVEVIQADLTTTITFIEKPTALMGLPLHRP